MHKNASKTAEHKAVKTACQQGVVVDIEPRCFQILAAQNRRDNFVNKNARFVPFKERRSAALVQVGHFLFVSQVCCISFAESQTRAGKYPRTTREARGTASMLILFTSVILIGQPARKARKQLGYRMAAVCTMQ